MIMTLFGLIKHSAASLRDFCDCCTWSIVNDDLREIRSAASRRVGHCSFLDVRRTDGSKSTLTQKPEVFELISDLAHLKREERNSCTGYCSVIAMLSAKVVLPTPGRAPITTI